MNADIGYRGRIRTGLDDVDVVIGPLVGGAFHLNFGQGDFEGTFLGRAEVEAGPEIDLGDWGHLVQTFVIGVAGPLDAFLPADSDGTKEYTGLQTRIFIAGPKGEVLRIKGRFENGKVSLDDEALAGGLPMGYRSLGGEIEVPLGDRMFVFVEYNITRYDDDDEPGYQGGSAGIRTYF